MARKAQARMAVEVVEALGLVGKGLAAAMRAVADLVVARLAVVAQVAAVMEGATMVVVAQEVAAMEAARLVGVVQVSAMEVEMVAAGVAGKAPERLELGVVAAMAPGLVVVPWDQYLAVGLMGLVEMDAAAVVVTARVASGLGAAS